MSASKNLFLETQESEQGETGLTLELSGLLQSNKADLTAIVSEAVQRVGDGWTDATDALIYAKKGEYVFKSIIDGIKSKAVIPAERGYTKFNAELTEKMTGVKYDYTNCNDTEWNSLSAQLEAIKEQMKVRETFLKTVTKPMTIVDEETGETNQIQPPIKYGSLSIAMKLI